VRDRKNERGKERERASEQERERERDRIGPSITRAFVEVGPQSLLLYVA
jgi:hypothetical protein